MAAHSLLSFSCASIPYFADTPPDLHVAPYLQHVTPNGITVRWETIGKIIGSVAFGQGGQFDQNIRETKPVKIHEVKITGLKPGETYNYRAQYGDQVLETASFKTAPPSGTRVWKFAAYGKSFSFTTPCLMPTQSEICAIYIGNPYSKKTALISF